MAGNNKLKEITHDWWKETMPQRLNTEVLRQQVSASGAMVMPGKAKDRSTKGQAGANFKGIKHAKRHNEA